MIDLPVIHSVPEMPAAMLGVVSVRGSLTAVYSPEHALGVPLALRAAVLIFRDGRALAGILIDDVDDAITVDLQTLRRTHGPEADSDLVAGVVHVGDQLVSLVDAAALVRACQTATPLEIA